MNEILKKYENFLQNIPLEKHASLRKIKTVEKDLVGDLNPTSLLEQCFFAKHEWVNFEEFYERYRNQYLEQLKDFRSAHYAKLTWDRFWQGLKARLWRIYVGFLTEYHAYYMAMNTFGGSNVRRGADLDKKGVDFQILHGGITYNIHVFVDSERAWKFRLQKLREKGSDQTQGIHVNLPYTLREGKISSVRFLPNGFGVYTSDYFTYLKKEIETGNLKRNWEKGLRVVGTGREGFIYRKTTANVTPHELK